jgi:hypothetical protein
MSAKVTFLVGLLLIAGVAEASAACSSEFEKIAGNDAATGNLNKSVYRLIVAELASVKRDCAAGREAQATRGLAIIKSRHGYR